MSFTEDEIAYLRSQPLARLATLGPDEQPDVVPVACEFDGAGFWVGGGPTVLDTRKIKNVVAGRRRVALVIDDHPSFDPICRSRNPHLWRCRTTRRTGRHGRAGALHSDHAPSFLELEPGRGADRRRLV